MRGYRYLKETDQLDFFFRIKDDFTNTPLLNIVKHGRKSFFGAGIEKSELVVRQFLIYRFVNLNFNKVLLEALGKKKTHLLVPLPPEWRIILEQYGFVSNTFANKLIWLAYVLFYFAYGITIGLKALFRNKIKFKKTSNNLNNRSVYFHSLTPNNLPINKNRQKSYDIISWYLSWKDRISNPSAILHSIKGVPPQIEQNGTLLMYTESGVPSLEGGSQYFSFLKWLVFNLPLALLDFLRGRYVHALIFGEACNSAVVRKVTLSKLSKDYLFHNSGWIFRPLWTYDAEARGSRILFYFYSTGVENLKPANGFGIQPYSWQIVTWPNYLVWNQYQSDFIKRAVGENNNISIVGPIWFQETDVQLPALPSEPIVVFDVQPQRDAQYQMHVVSPEFIVPRIVNKFLSDIHDVVRVYGKSVVLKRKRHLGNLLNKEYKFFIDRISVNEDFILVDSNLSAQKLIEHAGIVISFPFTSTAIIAQSQGKPSFFYDPSGIIQKDDRAAHGIEIVSGIKELELWFENFFKNKMPEIINNEVK